MLNRNTGKRCRLQKKGTPRIKPIKSGGSPTGVSDPPRLETINMKKIMIWLSLRLQEFIFSTGRTISILEPVVPMQLDRMVPMDRRTTFTQGEPARSPSKVMLPDTQYRPSSRIINVR